MKYFRVLCPIFLSKIYLQSYRPLLFKMEADAPITTSDLEWKKSVQKLLDGSGMISGHPRVYTSEEKECLQKMRASFPDETANPDRGEHAIFLFHRLKYMLIFETTLFQKSC